MLFEIFAASDAPSERLVPQGELPALQLATMNQLLVNTDGDRVKNLAVWRLLRTTIHSDFPCAWQYVKCEASDGLIESIYWKEGGNWCVRIPDFDPKWLPGTLKHVHISNYKSTHAFETRHLPRFVSTVEMTVCGFRGTLDLTVLPESMTTLILSRNHFHGTIRLTKLPPSLRKLILDNNEIEKLVVLNSSVPSFITEYGIRFQKAEKKLQAVCLDEKRVRRGIMFW